MFNFDFLIILSGLFYSVLCIFCIVTGIIYMRGKRELNPLELSEKTLNKLWNDEEKINFTKKMWFLTFIVWIVQWITAYSLFIHDKICYYFAIWFTIFSIGSVLFKLKNKINIFPITKLFFYTIILIILIVGINKYF